MSFFSNLNFGDLLNQASDVYTGILDKKTADQTTEQAQAAIEIERLKLEQIVADQQRIAAGKLKAKPISYVLPIIVTGVVIAGGIATYFIFKNKK